MFPVPSPFSSAPHERLEACGHRRRAAGGAPPRDRRQRRLCGRQKGGATQTALSSAAQATGGRRVVFHSPVRAATLVVNRWARSALSAAVVPVRPPRRGPAPLRQDRPGLAGERPQYTSLMLPGHLSSLPSRRLAIIARRSDPVHGHPLEPPINRGPELQLAPTPPLHSTKTPPSHWKSPEGVSFLNSGRRDLPRDPARFAPVRAPLPPISCQ